MEAAVVFSLWQSLFGFAQPAFSPSGQARFLQWVTALVLNNEEHTITQSLIGIDAPDDWRNLEYFAEYGAWNQPLFERRFSQFVDQTTGSTWYGYKVTAGDDTKVHRGSAHVWGTCTFHEYSARSPNRATTVRAHNWVVAGALHPQPHEPALFLPLTARLYFRASQLPTSPQEEVFRTKNTLLVELLQQQALWRGGQHLAVFDGGFAHGSVVKPLIFPEKGQPRVEFLTRLRQDARLHYLPEPRAAGQRGPQAKWGKRMPPPKQGGWWSGAWHEGKAFVYGRLRHVKWKEVVCQWHVLGHQVPVKVVVAEVEGYSKRFCLVSSAVDLTGLQLLEIFCARFRQEDGFRDLKQRLGWEECRAWTKAPLLRTTQVQLTTLTLLRLLQLRLQAEYGDSWWYHPPWNQRKKRPSVLDLERLFWKHRKEIQALLAEHLATCCNSQRKHLGRQPNQAVEGARAAVKQLRLGSL